MSRASKERRRARRKASGVDTGFPKVPHGMAAMFGYRRGKSMATKVIAAELKEQGYEVVASGEGYEILQPARARSSGAGGER